MSATMAVLNAKIANDRAIPLLRGISVCPNIIGVMRGPASFVSISFIHVLLQLPQTTLVWKSNSVESHLRLL
jgi:hypothetical protein